MASRAVSVGARSEAGRPGLQEGSLDNGDINPIGADERWSPLDLEDEHAHCAQSQQNGSEGYVDRGRGAPLVEAARKEQACPCAPVSRSGARLQAHWTRPDDRCCSVA